MSRQTNPDDDWLISGLRRLARWHRTAFATSCAQRQCGTFVWFQRNHPSGLTLDYPLVLGKLWNSIIAQRKMTAELEESLELCEITAQELLDSEAPFSLQASNAASTLCYAIQCLDSDDEQSALWAAKVTEDAIFEMLESGINAEAVVLSPADVWSTLNQVDHAELMTRERVKQESDIRLLLSTSRLTNEVQQQLIGPWGTGRPSNIGLQ